MDSHKRTNMVYSKDLMDLIEVIDYFAYSHSFEGYFLISSFVN